MDRGVKVGVGLGGLGFEVLTSVGMWAGLGFVDMGRDGVWTSVGMWAGHVGW